MLALLPTVRDEIFAALPVEQISEQLQQERQERLRRQGGSLSEAASTEFPSVPPSNAGADDDSKSLSSSSYVHASQMAGSTLEGVAARPRRSKAQLWQDMKIEAIARALTLIYLLSLLTLFTRIQLNLLGRRTYLSSVVALASPQSGGQGSTISLENRDDDGYDNVYGNDFEINRQYLTFSWWLLHRGSKTIMERVMAAVKEVFGPVNIREDITLERLSELLLEVRRKIEGETEEQRKSMKWLTYLLPPREQEAFVVRQAGGSESGDSPAAETKPDPMSTAAETPEDVADRAQLRRLLDETSDLIDSPVFCQVLTRVLDAAYSHLVDYRIATESFKVTGPTAPGMEQPRVTEVTDTKCKLAHILPVFCRQAHAIAAGSGELDALSGVAAQEPLGNEYLAAIDRVGDVEAFAAVIYSSNFEYEVEQGQDSTAHEVMREEKAPMQHLEPEPEDEEDEPVAQAKAAAAVFDETAASVVGARPETAPGADQPLPTEPTEKPAEAGLEAAWQRALATEDGEKPPINSEETANAPIPVQDE